jgi:hypothetical protein
MALMPTPQSYTAMVLASGAAIALLLAPPAGAQPNCTNTNAFTTLCQGSGNAQIHTAPNPASITNPLWWPTEDNVGGFFFGFGRGLRGR